MMWIFINWWYNNSPIFDEVILEGLVSFRPWCGEAAFHHRGQAVHPLLRFHAKVQGIMQAELRRRVVGLWEISILEKLQGEGEDSLTVAGQFQIGAPHACLVLVWHLVFSRELTGDWEH